MEAIKSMILEKDIKWVSFFNIKLKCRFLDKATPVFTHMGSATITVSICFLLIGIGNSLVRHMGIEALLSLVLSHIVVQVLKRSICRKRPKDVLTEMNSFKVPVDLYSFPSGHTTAVFSIATAVSLCCPELAVLLFPVAFLVGMSRLYIGVHYPSDVITGFFIAVITSLIVHFMIF